MISTGGLTCEKVKATPVLKVRKQPQVQKSQPLNGTTLARDVVSTELPKKKREAFGHDPRPQTGNQLEGKSNGYSSVPQRMMSYESWDVTRSLPKAERERLSPAERTMIKEVVAELKESAQQQGLGYVPVFGYLSLRKDNYRELGLKSQSEVQEGKHVVDAKLDGHDIGVVASTIYRGTPEYPGVVAGLSARPDALTEGTVLKVPLDRAEELLGLIFHREYFAEDDLEGETPQAMYKPVLREVTTKDGEKLKALVFITNPDSKKDINPEGKMTPGELAWFMGASGGFRSPRGHHGGLSFDYWSNAYFGADKVIREAIELAKYVPSPEMLDHVSQHALTDERCMRALDTILELFRGAGMPISLKTQQRDGQSLVRDPVKKPVDVQAEIDRLLALDDVKPMVSQSA